MKERTGLVGDDVKQSARLRHKVQFTLRVFAKTGDLLPGGWTEQWPRALRAELPILHLKTSDEPRTMVAIKVSAGHRGVFCPSVDITADDRAGSVIVRVIQNGQCETGSIAPARRSEA